MGKMQAEPPDNEEPAVKTIDRAARLLWILAQGDSEGLALSAIGRASGFGKGTTHRLLAALVEAGFAFQDEASRRYRLGAGLSLLARIGQQQDIGAIAAPFLQRLAEATADTVYASVREGPAAVCVGSEIGSFPIRTLSLAVGHRRPLGVGSGSLALLAFLPDEEIELILKQNEAWFREFKGYDAAHVRTAIAKSRKQGFAFVDGRIVQGMNAIGVPVYDKSRRIVAALSLAAIADRVSGKRIAEIVAILQNEAKLLGDSLFITSRKAPHTAEAV
jgi:DNA-binding IclR family transcriptional regulator